MLAKRIQEVRKRKGLTQEQLARNLNVSKSTIAMWETGKRDPDSKMITFISDYFNVSADYLLGNTDDPNPPRKKTAPEKLDPDIVSIQRLHENLTPKDREKFMKIIRTMFEEDFPKENDDDIQK